MTANQRRSGFRLPWSSEPEDAVPPADQATEPTTTPDQPAPSDAGPPAAEAASRRPVAPEGAASDSPAVPPETGAPAPEPAGLPATAASPASPPANDEPSPDFMRELVEAMRRVALETRASTAAAARSAADERVKELEADAERRRAELRERADADVAAVGAWAKAEAERIRMEAEARVAARQAQLEQELAAETARGESETKSVRDRITEYERELEAFTAQLNEINDPAAFAAAAKRMPRPPVLRSEAPAAETAAEPSGAAPITAPSAAAGEGTVTAGRAGLGMTAGPTGAPDVPQASVSAATNGAHPEGATVHPAEEEVLAARLAELDAAVPAGGPAAGAIAPPATVTTEIVVKGLGSFGAITSFRQALAGVEGVDGVALRLGETGEFIFRTTHAASFDVEAAIKGLEGDAARVERRGDLALLVTLERGR